MKHLKIHLYLLTFIAIVIGIVSCTKSAGPGGKAKVTGRVYAYDYDNTFRYQINKGYTSGETVYICYGDKNVVGNDVKTAIDGAFEFLYLNKGHYKVFVNTIDTSIKVKGNGLKVPVIKEFDITSAKQVIDLGDIQINK